MNQPFVVAYGMGVDSTAMLIGLSGIGIRPDLILFADVGGEKDETYAYQTIMDRERCKEEIRVAGLPVPPKSSCFFCPAMKPQEIDKLPIHLLRRIVIMEARAKPRLTDIDGLWRKGCKGSAAAWPGPVPSRSTSGSTVFFLRKKSTASLPKSPPRSSRTRRHLLRGKRFPPGTNSFVPW